MRIRRSLPILLAVVIVAAALTLVVQLRKHAPPEPARLLPGADAFFYLNLKWMRAANAMNQLPPVSPVPEYGRFIEETGFQFERDLDEAAFAVHYPASWPGGGTGGPAPEVRFSEVLVGRFQGERLTAYLRQLAQSVEDYHALEIFSIPMEGRTLRVAVLSVDSVAASNHDDPAVIRGMVDRSRRLASPFGGPAMLRRYYKYVQFTSPLWIVAHIEPSAPEFGALAAFLPKPADLVISGAYNPLHLPRRPSGLHLRAEAWTASSADARGIADKLNIFLAMFHAAETSAATQGTDPDVKAFFDSLQVRHADERAILTATIPPGFLRKVLAEGPPQTPALRAQPQTQQPARKAH